MPCHQPLLWLEIQGTAWDADSSQWATRVKKKKKNFKEDEVLICTHILLYAACHPDTFYVPDL